MPFLWSSNFDPVDQSRDGGFMEPSQMLLAIAQEMVYLGVEFDPALSSVECDQDIHYVSIALTTLPEDERSRDMMRSATHVMILTLFPGLRISVSIHAPPPPPSAAPLSPPSRCPPSETVSAWLRTQQWKTSNLALGSCRNLLRATFQSILTSLPWRDTEGMQARFRSTSASAIDRFQSGDTTMLFAPYYCDYFLPRPEGVVDLLELFYVNQDVSRVLGRKAESLLEFYEILHAICRAPQIAGLHPATHLVYARTFFPCDSHLRTPRHLSRPLTDYIRGHIEPQTFMAQVNETLCYGTCESLLQTYPWHDSKVMQVHTNLLVEQLRALAATGTVPALTPRELVEHLLPEMKTLATPSQADSILVDVCAFLKREPEHLLEVYEAVYCMQRQSGPIKMLRDKLFAS